MAIYIRSRPTTGTMVLGCLLTLIAVGIVLLLPAALFLAGYALASMEEAARYPSESSSVGNGAAQIVTVTTTYSFMLTAVTFGAVFCFKGTNRWLTKNSTVTHRDIASARFLHVAKDPNSRAAGMLWAMLAGMLLVASPFIVIAVPYPPDLQRIHPRTVRQGRLGHDLPCCRAVRGPDMRRRTPAGNRGAHDATRHGGREPGRVHPPPAFQPRRARSSGGSDAPEARPGTGRLQPTCRRCRAGQASSPLETHPDGEALTARRRPLSGRGPARRGLAGRPTGAHPTRAGGDSRRTTLAA